MSSAYEKALKNLKKNQKLFAQQERPQGVPPAAASAFGGEVPIYEQGFWDSDNYARAMEGKVAINRNGLLGQPEMGGGNRLMDIADVKDVGSVGLPRRGGVTASASAPAPRRVVAPANVPLPRRGIPAPEQGLAYGRGMSHGNRLDFLGDPEGYNQVVDADRAAGRVPNSQTQYVPMNQARQDTARALSPQQSQILDLF